jgi:hypothetical protein
MSFLSTPQRDAYSFERLGGNKAVENGFLILGSGPGEILEYTECPTPVALAWRDALTALLASYRPGRPMKQLDWLAIAASVDEPWARDNGWVPPEAPAVSPLAPPPKPKPLAPATAATPQPSGPTAPAAN